MPGLQLNERLQLRTLFIQPLADNGFVLTGRRLKIFKKNYQNYKNKLYVECNYDLFLTDICGESLITLRQSETYNLTSPGYPGLYPVDVLCEWIISVQGDGLPLIEFLDFNLALPYDYLRFGDAVAYSYELSGNQPPNFIIANVTDVKLSFDSYVWNYGFNGFLLELSATPSNSKLWIQYPVNFQESIEHIFY